MTMVLLYCQIENPCKVTLWDSYLQGYTGIPVTASNVLAHNRVVMTSFGIRKSPLSRPEDQLFACWKVLTLYVWKISKYEQNVDLRGSDSGCWALKCRKPSILVLLMAQNTTFRAS